MPKRSLDGADSQYERYLRLGRRRSLDALHTLARQVDPLTDDLSQFYRRLSASVADLVNAQAVAFFLLRDGELFAQAETYGIKPEVVAKLQNIPCREEEASLAADVAFRGATLRLAVDANVAALAPYRAWLEALNAYDFVTVPWAVGDLRLGLVAAYNSDQRRGFSDQDEWVLQVAAATAAMVWQQRRLAAQALRAHEIENALIREEARRVTDLEDMKRRILNLAAHELRGPIAVIRGYISMMSEGTLDAVTLRRILPILTGKAAQMDSLVTQMLEVARLEEGRLELKLTVADLRQIARGAVDVAALLAPTGISVFLEQPASEVLVRGDTDRLATIVGNLLDNAIKYSLNGGSIVCSVGVEDSRAYVRVKDEGIGIAPQSMSHLFERFGRIVTPETSHVPGTGLGLHLSRELALLHGGDITVESTAGVGSTFTLWLPCFSGGAAAESGLDC